MATTTTAFRTLGPSAKLPDDCVNPYTIEDLQLRVAVVRVDGKLYAFDHQCTNDDFSLSAGLLAGTTLVCRCRGCRFDIETGAVLRGPAIEPLATYDVHEEDGQIQIRA